MLHVSKYHLLFILCLSFGLMSCASSIYDNIDRAEGYKYQPGHPEFRLASYGYFDEQGQPHIVVSGDVVEGSLIYSKKDKLMEAPVTIEIQIKNEATGEQVISETYQKTIAGKSEQITSSQDIQRFEHNYKVDAGAYLVKIAITDNTNKKTTTRTTHANIPMREEGSSHMTDIWLLGKNSSKKENTFNQITTYDIPSRIDSLKFIFQIIHEAKEPAEIELRLIRFEADTTPAHYLHGTNYSPSSMRYKGIDFDKYEVIQSSTRPLSQQGSVLIELPFHNLKRGNYRLEVYVNKDEPQELFRGRGFSIKSPNYPSLSTPEELAKPLYYLMTKKEYEKLMDISDPNALKNAVDRFWLSNINNSRVAKYVLSLYYQRVEKANKQFSNYKEGWKTDPGMMYILFGPPWYSRTFSNEMRWSYSYNREDPETNFLFIRPKRKSKYYPFNNYILQRSQNYYTINYQQIQLWLTGLIIRDPM